MESVPGAVATGPQLSTKSTLPPPHQVATAPCTDLIAQIKAPQGAVFAFHDLTVPVTYEGPARLFLV
jgi:hypothetical protein